MIIKGAASLTLPKAIEYRYLFEETGVESLPTPTTPEYEYFYMEGGVETLLTPTAPEYEYLFQKQWLHFNQQHQNIDIII